MTAKARGSAVAATVHCQDLGQQPLLGFAKLFFYIWVCAELFWVWNHPGSVILRKLYSKCSERHIVSVFCEIREEFMHLEAFHTASIGKQHKYPIFNVRSCC